MLNPIAKIKAAVQIRKEIALNQVRVDTIRELSALGLLKEGVN